MNQDFFGFRGSIVAGKLDVDEPALGLSRGSCDFLWFRGSKGSGCPDPWLGVSTTAGSEVAPFGLMMTGGAICAVSSCGFARCCVSEVASVSGNSLFRSNCFIMPALLLHFTPNQRAG